MKLHFFVRDDVYQAGTDECGGIIEGLVYYVVAETDTGRRFAHNHSFTDDGVWQRGAYHANHLLARIEAKRKICETIFSTVLACGGCPEYWNEIDPAYGSGAYQGLDAEKFFRNREISEAHDAGEISEHEACRLMMR